MRATHVVLIVSGVAAVLTSPANDQLHLPVLVPAICVGLALWALGHLLTTQRRAPGKRGDQAGTLSSR
jgi:hypothetical protein